MDELNPAALAARVGRGNRWEGDEELNPASLANRHYGTPTLPHSVHDETVERNDEDLSPAALAARVSRY